jgi:general secretion pathway protein F
MRFMPSFSYIARNAAGGQVTGTMQADTQSAAVRSLTDRRLFPVQVRPEGGAGAATVSSKSPAAPAGSASFVDSVLAQFDQLTSGGSAKPQAATARVKRRDVGVWYGQLADLLNAGVPMLRSLDTLARATRTTRMGPIVAKTRDAVSQGATLADALALEPAIFPALHTSMIKAGESGGFLEEVLTNLAVFIERQDELASKVRGALIYPALLTTVGAAVLLIALTMLVPKFKPLFQNIPLPAPTVILFAMSDLVMKQWPFVLAGMAMIGMFLYSATRSEQGRQAFDRYRFKIPVAGHAIKMTCLTRFCRILGTLLANGVPILASLGIARGAAGSVLLAEAIDSASESVRAGQPLAQPLRDSELFPTEIIEMIAVAEESNQLEKVLVQIADTVERRTNRQVDDAVRLIEPLILIILASVIGFIAMGLLYPIFTMSQTLK